MSVNSIVMCSAETILCDNQHTAIGVHMSVCLSVFTMYWSQCSLLHSS